ncbi:NAD(P)/FAD-dependent oxidoreductase [Neptunicella sp. SCSIO 80796]|uniref:NAD(P)/FAD-dependent oxidoreductase n=1 Tax=Neptunicella plasticusilytica TaxID=3117012 RepID=UPI003A4DD2E4
MTNQFDVVVIGAGPAGACAAKMLVDSGLSVVVVEKEQFPRFSIGESLLPQCMSFLEQAGLKDLVDNGGFQYKNGAAFFKSGQYTVFNFAEKLTTGPATTYQVKRADFDKKLADAAEQAGAEIRYQHQVTSFNQQESNVVLGINDLDKQQQYQLQGRFVLDASGFGRVLPRLLDLESPSDFPVRQAIFTHIQDNLPASFDRHKILITVYPHNPDIWFWLIPFSDGTSSLGMVGEQRFFSEFTHLSEEQILWHFIQQTEDLADLLVAAKVTGPVRKIAGYTANVNSLYGERYALLGNAGEFLDPVFSSGVTIALKSAVLAAPLVHKQLKGESVDWQSEFSQPLRLGISTFRHFVVSWYDRRLQDIIFYPHSQPEIKQMICSILAGYAWDQANPYVGGNGKRLKVLAEICAN